MPDMRIPTDGGAGEVEVDAVRLPTGLPCASSRRTARWPSLRSTPTTGPSARTSSF